MEDTRNIHPSLYFWNSVRNILWVVSIALGPLVAELQIQWKKHLFQPQVLDDSATVLVTQQWVDQRLLSMQKPSMQLVPLIGRGQMDEDWSPCGNFRKVFVVNFSGMSRERTFPIHLVQNWRDSLYKNTWSKGVDLSKQLQKMSWVEKQKEVVCYFNNP